MDGFYRFLGDLLPERRDRLGRAVRQALRGRGVKLPRQIRVVADANGRRGMAFALWGSRHGIAWGDEDRRIPHRPFIDAVAELVLDGRLMHARDDALRRANDGLTRSPGWSVLAHPVTILLLRMAGMDPSDDGFFDRGGSAPKEPPPSKGGEAGDLQDFYGALSTSGRYDVKRIKVSLGNGRALSMLVLPTAGDDERMETLILAHGITLADTIMLELPGRRLLDVLEMGNADPVLHEALGRLRIVKATTNEHGSSFSIEPTRWIPCGTTPDGARGWNDDFPWVA